MSTPEPSVTSESKPTQPPGRSRRLGLLSLGAVVVLCGFGYLGYWFFDGRYYESTDDAYVNGDVVQVTSEIPGTVIALNADDTQLVHAGQSLLELDPADARIAEANAEADLARAVRQVRGLFAQGKELRAQIDQREQAERTADDDLKRRGGLIADGAISAEELSHARDAVTTTRANVAAADARRVAEAAAKRGAARKPQAVRNAAAHTDFRSGPICDVKVNTDSRGSAVCCSHARTTEVLLPRAKRTDALVRINHESRSLLGERARHTAGSVSKNSLRFCWLALVLLCRQTRGFGQHWHAASGLFG